MTSFARTNRRPGLGPAFPILAAHAVLALGFLAISAGPSVASGPVTILVEGRRILVEPEGQTVADALRSAGLALRPDDRVTPPLTAPLAPGGSIRIVRVEVREITTEEAVPAPTVVRPSAQGRGPYHPTVTTAGQPGLARRTYRVTIEDGKERDRAMIGEKPLRDPVPAVVTARPGYLLASRGGVYAGRRVFEMVATAYDPGPGSCPGTADGVTCNGKRAGYGIAAVDPKVIPLGSKLYIEGYGYAIAADVGSAIQGNRIDLGYNSRSGAMQWGRRKVVVYVLD